MQVPPELYCVGPQSVQLEGPGPLQLVQLASHAMHTRFCVVFPLAQAVLSYWLLPHAAAHAVHTRLLVAVGAVLWY
jgi:hypothetical protein